MLLFFRDYNFIRNSNFFSFFHGLCGLNGLEENLFQILWQFGFFDFFSLECKCCCYVPNLLAYRKMFGVFYSSRLKKYVFGFLNSEFLCFFSISKLREITASLNIFRYNDIFQNHEIIIKIFEFPEKILISTNSLAMKKSDIIWNQKLAKNENSTNSEIKEFIDSKDLKIQKNFESLENCIEYVNVKKFNKIQKNKNSKYVQFLKIYWKKFWNLGKSGNSLNIKQLKNRNIQSNCHQGRGYRGQNVFFWKYYLKGHRRHNDF